MNESDSQSLDDYLATFYQSATLDSQGRFTIDLQSRARKTASFQLLQPELFLIPLLMAAALGGAARFEIESVGAGFSLVFDGEICSQPELAILLDNLENRTPDSSEPRLHHLQAALRLAQELAVDEICLQPAGAARALQWTARRWQIRPAGGAQGLLFQLRENPLARLFGSRLVKIRAALQKLLARRGAFRLNWSEPSAVAQLQIGSEVFGPCLGVLPSPHSGLLSLLPWGSASESLLIHHGVVFPLPAQRSTRRRPYRLLLRSAAVSPDLSYQSLVQSEELQAILQAIPSWVGELEWAHLLLSPGWEERATAAREVFWDVRQRALHRLPEPEVEWTSSSGVTAALHLGRGIKFADASRAYGLLHYLPVTWDKGAPLQLDQGAALLARPTPRDDIVDLVYPRQREFLAAAGRAVPATVLPGQMLPEGEFWHCSPLIEGVQVGLNLVPQRHGPLVWHFDTRESDGRLHFWKAEVPGEAMPPGLTVAAVNLGPRALPWQRCLLEVFRLAWLDPRTELDRARHAALLEHWLLAARIPSLRGQLNSESIWIWNQQDGQVFLSDLPPGQDQDLVLTPEQRSQLRSLWGYANPLAQKKSERT